jgi:hypothetical protein
MVLADFAGNFFAAAGTDKEMSDYSPLCAGDHFDMGEDPLGNGGGTVEHKARHIIKPKNYLGTMGL